MYEMKVIFRYSGNCLFIWLQIETGSDNVEEVATTLNERTANNKFGPGDLKKTTLDLFPKLNEQLITQTRGMTKRQKRNKVKKFAKVCIDLNINILKNYFAFDVNLIILVTLLFSPNNNTNTWKSSLWKWPLVSFR